MSDRISVIMACYERDTLPALIDAVESVQSQTAQFYEFIIVVDGPIDELIDNYLNELAYKDSRIRIIRYKENKGAAFARNLGMSESNGDYIAIMDADDISMPDRFEQQLAVLRTREIDAVWGWQEEFYDGTNEFAGIKKCSEHHEQILSDLRFRCLLSDPTTFIRRACFEKTGGYGMFNDVNIDHQFFVKMAMSGFRFYCIPKILIKVRVSREQRRRRGGVRCFIEDLEFRKWLREESFISQAEYVKSVLVYGVFRMLPNNARDLIYRHILRHKSVT